MFIVANFSPQNPCILIDLEGIMYPLLFASQGIFKFQGVRQQI